MAFSAANLDAAIEAAINGTTHVQLHDGDPGGAGTSNVLAEMSARAATNIAGETAGGDGEVEDDAISFTITGACGPITHITGWSASTSGTYQWTAVLSPQETFAGAGTLDVTLTATAADA